MHGMDADRGPQHRASARNRPNGESLDDLVGLDEAAKVLGVSHQTLFRVLTLTGAEVHRVMVAGRRVTAIAVDDLSRVRDALSRIHPENGGEAGSAGPLPEPTWVRARQLEGENEELRFEGKVLSTRLEEARARLADAEQTLEATRSELERARERLSVAQAQGDELDEARHQLEILGGELRAARAELADSEGQRASLEHRLSLAREVERSTQRYCDRLEQKLQAAREEVARSNGEDDGAAPASNGA